MVYKRFADLSIWMRYEFLKNIQGNGFTKGQTKDNSAVTLWEKILLMFGIYPNVKAKHIEKTDHPCQFPVAIPQRLIKALTNKNGLVLDPFMGSGTTGVAALIEGRRFVGSEIQKSYFDISVERIKDASDGKAKIREDRPVTEPNPECSSSKITR